MPHTLETFDIAGEKTGALVRNEDEAGLYTLVCFIEPSRELIHNESRIWYVGDPRAWTSYDSTEHHAGQHRRVARADALPPNTIPGYATYLLVREPAQSGAKSLEFYSVTDGDSDAAPTYTELRRTGDIITELTAGAAGNRYWLDAEGVVTSDWQGAESRRVADTQALLSGLRDDVALTVGSFLHR